jgi:hypothetical protein
MKLKRASLAIKTSLWAILVCAGMVTLAGLAGARSAVLPAGQQAESQLPVVLTEARIIRIEDDWGGFSPFSPLKAHYQLQRGASDFSGKATFSARRYARFSKEVVEDISIPIDKANGFLSTLSGVRITPGKYVPRIEHTDDYPSIRIQIELKDQKIDFFTESQGERHVPWGATISGKSYIVDSDLPSRALESLRPYLKRDVLTRLVNSIQSNKVEEPGADAIAYIESAWRLTSANTGGAIFQETERGRAAGGGRSLPVFLMLPDGSIEPALTVHHRQGGIPIRGESAGTGFVVMVDGFILTSRRVAAGWDAPYGWDEKRYRAGGMLYVLDEAFRRRRRRRITHSELPGNWIAAEARLLDGRTVTEKSLTERPNYLNVWIAPARKRIPAKIVALSDRRDLAMLKVDVPEPLKKVELDDNAPVIDGLTPATALGYQVGGNRRPKETKRAAKEEVPTLKSERCDVVRREKAGGDLDSLYELSLTRAEIGSSGGPVFTRNGSVIGIVSFFGKPDGPGVGAVPIRYAMDIMGIKPNSK